MIYYHKIFIGVEFGKKDVWQGNILYVIIITGCPRQNLFPKHIPTTLQRKNTCCGVSTSVLQNMQIQLYVLQKNESPGI